MALELRRLVRAQDRTLAGVSAAAGYSRNYLSQLIRGVQDLKVEHIVRVLDVLGVPHPQFFAGVAASLAGELRAPGLDVEFFRQKITESAAVARTELGEDLDDHIRRIVRQEIGKE